MTMRTHSLSRLARLTAVIASLAGCDILDVKNPGQIPVTDLNNPNLVTALVTGAIGDFTHMYDDPFIWRGSMFTDEQVTGINWEQTARLNLRIVRFNEGDADGMFGGISRALRQAEGATERLRTLLTAPNSDGRLATTLAYAGYSYVVMGEAMCQATVSQMDPITGVITPGTGILPTDSLFRRAISRFTEAVNVATVANNTQILNLARVGLARTYLNLGDMANTKVWAALVPASFKYWLEYSANTPRENNVMQARVTGANHALGMYPKFLQSGGLAFGTQSLAKYETDPRIQHTSSWTTGHNALTRLYKPYQGLRYSGYTGRVQGIYSAGTGTYTVDATTVVGTNLNLYQFNTNILLADYNEAQHDFAEADGPTAATLAFVNARRAVGNQTAVSFPVGDPAIMAELREQRARDLFLGGFRLGDLRRWKRQGVGDFFPTGPHVNATWGNYSNAECYPIPLQEYESNPNIKDLKPAG